MAKEALKNRPGPFILKSVIDDFAGMKGSCSDDLDVSFLISPPMY